MLLSAAIAVQCADLATSDLFFRDAHRRLFESMQRVIKAEGEVDLVSVKHDLTTKGDLDEVGGPAYITSLVDGLPRSTNVEHYIAILRDLKGRRDLIFYANKVSAQAYSGEDSAKVVMVKADEWLGKLAGDDEPDDLVPQSEAALEYGEYLNRRMETRNALLGLTTGFPTLDDLTCGLEPGHTTVVAAATGGGKTVLALNVACSAAEACVYDEAGGAVVFASLEMEKTELETRIVSHYAGVEQFRIRKGWLTEQESKRVYAALARTMAWPLYIDDTSTMTVRSLRSRCRRLAASGVKIRLLVVDYIQLMSGDDPRENRTEALGTMTRGLKLLARELKCHVIELSQLTKAPGKDKRKPTENDLRESGAIAQHASNIWFLWKEDPETLEGVTELILAKQRNGPTATAEFYFDKPVQRFIDNATQETKTMEPVQTGFSLDTPAASFEVSGSPKTDA